MTVRRLPARLQRVPYVDDGGAGLRAFARAVEDQAYAAPARFHFGRYKTFLAAVPGAIDSPSARALLWRAHQARYLHLARADLTPAMDPALVRASEVHLGPHAVFHFVMFPEDRPWTAPSRDPRSAMRFSKLPHRDTPRNVRWHEDRQDRAAEADARRQRAGKRLLQAAWQAGGEAATRETEAARLRRKTPGSRRAATLEKEAKALRARERALNERVQALGYTGRLRARTADRYGRAKARVGVYNAPGTSGWTDRDPRRTRKSTMPARRDTTDLPYRIKPAPGGEQRQAKQCATYADAQRGAWDWLRRGRAPAVSIEIRGPRSKRNPNQDRYRPMEWWTIGTSGKFKHSYDKPAARDWDGDSAGHSKVARGAHYTRPRRRGTRRDWTGDHAGHSRVARGEHYTSGGLFGRDPGAPRDARRRARGRR